jgi:transposase-like protein
MIRKNSLFGKIIKQKTSTKFLFEHFMDHVKPFLETCPVCHSHGNLKIHSYYKRKLIDFVGGKPVYQEIMVTRVICESCGATHAILPDFIIPYSSYSLFFILRVLAEYFLHMITVEKLCERFCITVKQLYKWIELFKIHKQHWLGTLDDSEMKESGFLKNLSRIGCYSDFSSGFVRKLSFSFMQSHANPPTAVYCQDIFAPDYRFYMTTQPYQ